MLSNHSYNNGNDSNNNNNASSNLNDNRGAIVGNAASVAVESSAAAALSTAVEESTAALGLEQQHQLSQIVAAVTDATSSPVSVVDPYNSLMAAAAAAAAAAVRKSVKQEFLSGGAGDHVDYAVKSSTDGTPSSAGN